MDVWMKGMDSKAIKYLEFEGLGDLQDMIQKKKELKVIFSSLTMISV